MHEPLLGIYAGYSLGGQVVKLGPGLEPYVQEGLEEIEYVTGGTDTKWGAVRARDGHPAPFTLRYVEVGNEDNFDGPGPTMAGMRSFTRPSRRSTRTSR